MFTLLWPDILAITLGLYAINSAIGGQLRTYGRGGRHRTFLHLESVASRVTCALVGLVILACVVLDLRRKFPA
jgi:hypothetical protein